MTMQRGGLILRARGEEQECLFELRFEHMHFYFLLISKKICYNETIIYWN